MGTYQMANTFDQFDGNNAFNQFDAPAQPSQQSNKATASSRIADTLGHGVNRGIANIAGLPVDTALNVWDLIKAGAGSVQGLVTGKAPSAMFDPADRSQYVGSGEWNANQLNKTNVTDTRLSHPEDAISRYGYTAGTALPGALMAQPSTLPQAATAITQNVLPALAAQGTAEATKGTQYENSAPILASLLAQGAPQAISATAKALTPRPDANTANAANVLENAGVTLDASQRTGGLKSLKKLVQDNPFTAGSEAEKAQTQKQQFTQAALRLMGEDAPAATKNVMDRAQNRIGGVMDRVESNTIVPYNNKLHTELTDLLKDAKSELGPSSSEYGAIEAQVHSVIEKASLTGGDIPGDAIARSRQSLNRMGMGNNASVKEYAGRLKGVLQDAVKTYAAPQDMADYTEALQQYRIMKQIEPVIDNQGDGMISPARLPTSIAKGNAGKNQTVYGRGDQRLVELAQAGSKLLPDRFPNSGTAARAAAQLLPHYMMSGFGPLLYGNPWPALKVIASTAGAPKLAQTLLNSPTALTGSPELSLPRQMQYAAAQATQLTPEQRRKLIAKQISQ